jgi:hypothetical protein
VQQTTKVIDIKEEFYKMQKEGIKNLKISQLSESIYERYKQLLPSDGEIQMIE